MADKFLLESNASQLIKNFQKMMEETPIIVRSVMSEMVDEAMGMIAADAPSPEMEYDFIMRGLGAVELIPLGGNQSADPDGRIRFIREPGMWMREAVYAPENRSVDLENLTVRFGNVPFLVEACTFSFMNKNGAEYSTNFDGQLFSLLEAGGSYTVSAVNAARLSPDTNKKHRTRSMTKTFTGFRMYSGFDPAVFSKALAERLNFNS